MGDPNASIPTPQPVYYRPMFAQFDRVLQESCVTFLSQAALGDGIGHRLHLTRQLFAVRVTYPATHAGSLTACWEGCSESLTDVGYGLRPSLRRLSDIVVGPRAVSLTTRSSRTQHGSGHWEGRPQQ